MDKVQKAVESFHNPYSCAQAVAAAFDENISAQKLDFMKQNSAGKAPNGICGALFAAIDANNGENADIISKEFAKAAGSTKCREIKTLHKTPCAECVRIAASIAKNHIK